MIPVTKTFLPPLEEYNRYLEQIWQSGWVTNNGELSQLLEKKLENFLDVPHLQYVSSGTSALQIALRVLGISGEVITTPFSYVATTSSILWEGCHPVYVDIKPDTLTIDPEKIESAITDETTAILATHVFGIPCEVDALERIARQYDIKIIYDAAHAFGVEIGGKSVLNYGDLSALSFHATKLFHTVEGGGLVTDKKEISKKIFLSKTFGHRGNEHRRLGINAKNSELHAAMGLCLIPRIHRFIEKRKEIYDLYKDTLEKRALSFPKIGENVSHNYGYFPVIFDSFERMAAVKEALEENDIYPRRYFTPSLTDLPYISDEHRCPISSSISSRILCLPLYEDLSQEEVERICTLVNRELQKNK